MLVKRRCRESRQRSFEDEKCIWRCRNLRRTQYIPSDPVRYDLVHLNNLESAATETHIAPIVALSDSNRVLARADGTVVTTTVQDAPRLLVVGTEVVKIMEEMNLVAIVYDLVVDHVHHLTTAEDTGREALEEAQVQDQSRLLKTQLSVFQGAMHEMYLMFKLS